MRYLSLFLSSAVLAGLIAGGAAVGRAELTLTDLGSDFRPRAIDNQGRITGQLLSTHQAAIWDGDEFIELGTLGGTTSVGNAIYNGQVVGTSGNAFGTTSAFHRTTVMNELTTPFTGVNAVGIDVNAIGQKLGNVNVGGTKLIGLWNSGNSFSTALNSLSGTAFGINDSGDGVAVRDDVNTGILWLGTNPSMPARTFQTFVPSGGINNQRLLAGVVGGTTAGTFLFEVSDAPEPIPNIGSLGSTSSVGGLNNENELIGATNATVFHYNYDTRRLTDLNAQPFAGDPFDSLLDVRGINDNGLIVGTGLIGGVEHAFVAELTLGLLGDYDGNSMVDEDDFAQWASEFGMVVPAGTGSDGNGNGVVDAADYTVWRDHLGDGVAGAAAHGSALTVPEPSSLIGAVAGLLSMIGFRRTPNSGRS